MCTSRTERGRRGREVLKRSTGESSATPMPCRTPSARPSAARPPRESGPAKHRRAPISPRAIYRSRRAVLPPTVHAHSCHDLTSVAVDFEHGLRERLRGLLWQVVSTERLPSGSWSPPRRTVLLVGDVVFCAA